MSKHMYRLLEITGNGCANCVSMGAIIQELAMQYPDLEAISKDVQAFDKASLQALGVTQVPVLLLLQDEAVIGTVYGYQPKEILALWVESKMV